MKIALKSRKIISVLLSVIVIAATVFTVLAVNAAAASGEGMAFDANTMYQMNSSIPDRTAYTFEAEIYVPSNLGDTKRAYNLIGNWSTNAADRDKLEWNIEIHTYGVIRLFHTSGKSLFFHGGDNTAEITKSGNATNEAYLSTLKTEYYDKGDKAPFDIRKYTGTTAAPEYVKVTITADTVTGNASLYYNGEHIMTIEGSSALKGRNLTPSSKHPYHVIGGDYRDNNSGYFSGRIKNMAMYSDIRTAEEIKAYADSDVFSVDATDANLLFAYDMTKAKDGFLEDLSANHRNANNTNYTTDEGRTFTAEDNLAAITAPNAMPRTYEAWIYPTTTSRPGVIIGNYSSGCSAIVNFEIHSSGKPSVYIKNENGDLMETKFSYDIRRNAWAHLVITHETLATGGARFTCYVDGVKVDSFVTALDYEFNPMNMVRFQVGGDSRSNNSQYFKGRIKNIALYSDVLTEEQIVASYKSGIDTDEDSLLLHYELEGTEGQTFIEDQSDNGMDLAPLQPIFYENQSPAKDYAYSFAVVGDTQKLVYNDVYYGTDYTSYIYDWLVQNKNSKNIKFVLGVGDITEKNGKDQTSDDDIDQTDLEWNLAVAQHQKLYDAGIPYGIIMGNHDTVPQLDKYFAEDKNFTEADIGYYSGTSLGNYYMRFTVGETKYMMVGLEYGADDAVLDWAGEVIAANPEHRVIITTHAYMFRDGTTLDINDVVPPRKPTSTSGTKNNGDQMWTKLASQYANVIMVLSGHDPYANIARRQDVGVNGNTVTQMLIDFQSSDTTYKYQTGMVAMLYFSADGKEVQVEYISTYKTLEAQKLDANAKDVIFNSYTNQFSFTIPEIKTLESVECEYGTIPAAYANEITYPFVVFKADKTFIGAYGDLGEATAAAKEKGSSGNYYVLMRRDAEQSVKSTGLAGVRGSITIDLGGNTLYKSAIGYVFDMYVNDNSSSTLTNGYDARGTFSIKNGNIVSYDTSHPIACVNYGASLAKNYSIAFEFIDVKFTDLAGGCHILDSWENGYEGTTSHVYASVLFDNCTFDYAGSLADTTINMIQLSGDGNDRVIWDVEIRGGNIISNSAISSSTFISANDNTNGRADKVTFTAGEDGKYIIQILPDTAEAPNIFEVWSKLGDRDMFFAPLSKDEGYALYELQAGNLSDHGLVTAYGFVPNDQIDPENYPLLLFKNGAYIGRYDVFSMGTSSAGVLSGAKTLTDGNEEGEIGSTVEILFIGDAEVTGIFSNMGQILGTVIIDLNGHKLIQSYTSNSMLFTQAKYWKGMQDATFQVINGEMLLKTQLLTFSAYGELYQTGDGTDSYKHFNISFDNVKFSYANGSTATNFLGLFTDGASVFGKAVQYNVEFNGCTFDFTNAASMSVIMNANDNKTASENGEAATNCIVDVEVNGGKIITSNSEIDFFETVDNGSSVVFGKDKDDNYTTLSIASDNAGSDILNTLSSKQGITMAFANGKLEGEYVNYTLVPKVIADYNVKSSITLWSSFVYNVYLLKSDTLASISIDGTSYSEEALTVKEINGAEYYLVKIDLSAKESLRDISVVIALNTDGTTVRYTATLNVVKYAGYILEGEHSDEEKALVRDMLSYARAAYAYFETVDAVKLNAVDSLIGKNYEENSVPDMTKSPVKPTENRGFAEVTVNLGAVPSFRFYLADGYGIEDFDFNLGGRGVEVSLGSNDKGDYLDVTAYAYRMCDTVSYTVIVDGVEYTESFNIYAYYAYVLANHADDEALIALVERICKYSESAEAYRASVTAE